MTVVGGVVHQDLVPDEKQSHALASQLVQHTDIIKDIRIKLARIYPSLVGFSARWTLLLLTAQYDVCNDKS